jgi:hypothetical protein
MIEGKSDEEIKAEAMRNALWKQRRFELEEMEQKEN